MKKLLIICFLVNASLANAQYYTTYDWQSAPKKSTLTVTEKAESSIGIRHAIAVEYLENGTVMQQFNTYHTINHVNNEEGIQRHNRVYIPMYNVVEIVDIKARTINKAGKVTLLNKDNIKEVQNVEEYGDFKIFAIEGVEIDSDIEVLYTLEKDPYPFGSHNLQDEYFIREAEFLFIYGKSNGKVKAYRTNQPFTNLEVGEQQAKKLVLNNIPAMLEEEYSTPRANLISVAYQCFNAGNNIGNSDLWRNVSTNFASEFFPRSLARQVVVDMEKFLPKDAQFTDYQKVARMDDFVKTNFTIIDNNNPQLKEINYILKNRSASKTGILQVYGQYLRAMGISYQVVITADRYLHKFDPEFFTPGAIQNFLIYVPSIKQYLSPDRIEYRVGEAPFNLLGNQAIFINPDFTFSFAKIEQIDPNYSRIVRSTDVTFDADMENVIISQDHDYYGHWAVTNRAVHQLSPEAGRIEFEDYLTASGIEDKESLDLKLENEKMFQENPEVPFKVFSKIKSEALLEEAGDSYIFMAGLVIGTQSELYQEKKRVNPIEMQYPNQYNYTITINIPNGYEVEGLESLNIYKKLDGVNGPKCKFESSYVREGSRVIISIEEFYKENEIPIAEYETFRQVINAASDFNKASILLKPAKK